MVSVAQGEACRFSPRRRAVGFDVRVRVPHAAPPARAPVVGQQLACLLLADRVEVGRRASCGLPAAVGRRSERRRVSESVCYMPRE
jgi:hypothetical protein